MSTLVFFHAHPDDECTSTGGLMMLAHAAGHRVVLVTATDGSLGEIAEGVLPEGQSLAERRVIELAAAGEVLGVDRIEMLGYRDSGMEGESSNDDPISFWRTDIDEAARRLADIIIDEDAKLLTIYDDHGSYGHPDHIQVHRVGVRAAEMAGLDNVYEATINRDEMLERIESSDFGITGSEEEIEAQREEFRKGKLGVPAAQLTHALDISSVVMRKREALRCHASQIPPDSFFLAMPDEAFAHAFGTEYFTKRGEPRSADAPFRTDLFAGL